MKVVLFKLLVVCMFGAVHAGANIRPIEMDKSRNEERMERRYAESTIASEISKIMESMVQKNFVDFLLNQKLKRSKLAAVEERQYSDLVELGLHEKQELKV